MNYQSWWWGVLCVLLAGSLGAIQLNDGGLWNDEVVTVLEAGGDHYPDVSFEGIWDVATADAAYPPTWYYVAWIWEQLAGSTPVSIRMIGLLFGLVAVALTYRMGRDMVSPQVGFYAAFVMCSSAFFINYIHEARLYTMLVSAVGLAMLTYWHAINGGRRGWVVGLFFGCLALWYTHYMSAILAGALGLYHLLRGPRNQRWWVILAIMTTAGATFILWIPLALARTNHFANDAFLRTLALDARNLLQQVIRAFANDNYALLAAVGIYAATAIRERSIQLAAFVMLVTTAVILGLNERMEFIEQARLRYFLVIWPLAVLLVGVGIDRMTRRGLRPEIILSVWFAVGMWQMRDSRLMVEMRQHGSNVPHWELASEPLKAMEQPGDALVFFPSWSDMLAAEHYLYGLKMPYQVVRFGMPAGAEDYQRALALVPEAKRLWMVYDDPPALIGYTNLHFLVDSELAFCGVVPEIEHFKIYSYIRLPQTSDVRFGADLLLPEDVLEFSILQPPTLTADSQSVTVQFGWHVDNVIPTDAYTAQITIIEITSGAVHAKQEFTLPIGVNLCVNLTFDTTNFVSGQYEMALNVAAGGIPLPGMVAHESVARNQFSLGDFVFTGRD